MLYLLLYAYGMLSLSKNGTEIDDLKVKLNDISELEDLGLARNRIYLDIEISP